MIPKFRAWHNELGRMMLVKTMFFFANELEELELNDSIMNDNIPVYPDEIKLMQSTGLHDKNGKEIFEGDILGIETDEGVLNVNIFWDSKHALFMFESKKYNEEELLAELVEGNTYPFEIIGNIYENPELLEVAE
jgi:hypothetical protein|nr:MAG TPA: YopX protein [Caudoviricetes sp.]